MLGQNPDITTKYGAFRGMDSRLRGKDDKNGTISAACYTRSDNQIASFEPALIAAVSTG